jgi:3-oxoacyl-[acyl-carrier protein] reductase
MMLLSSIPNNGERMSRLSGELAIVAGASKGIGRGLAAALAAAGARVSVNYSSDGKGAQQAAQAIIDGGGEAITVAADVSKVADVARLFNEVGAAFEGLDVLVNNAAVFHFGGGAGAFINLSLIAGSHPVPGARL